MPLAPSPTHFRIPRVQAARRLAAASALLLLLAPWRPAAAQQPGAPTPEPVDPERMRTFMVSTFYRGMIEKALASMPPVVFHKCQSMVAGSSHVTIMRPIAFAPNGFPVSGSWKQSFPVTGCGNDTVLNFIFVAGEDRKINLTIGLPGTTAADLLLQRDAQRFATTAAVTAAKSCTAFVVTNTKFEAFGLRNPPTPDPGSERRLRPWWEMWTLAGCGRTFDVPVDFVPEIPGTKIIQPGDVVERQG